MDDGGTVASSGAIYPEHAAKQIHGLVDEYAAREGLRFGSCLDIGCGRSRYDKWFKRKFADAATPSRYLGLDEDPLIVEELTKAGVNVRQSPVGIDCTSDLTLCLEVIEHITAEDSDDFFRFVETQTRTLVALTTPNFEYWTGSNFKAVPELRECRWLPDHAPTWNPAGGPHAHKQWMTAEVLDAYFTRHFPADRWGHQVYRAWPWDLNDAATGNTFRLYFKLFAIAWRRHEPDPGRAVAAADVGPPAESDEVRAPDGGTRPGPTSVNSDNADPARHIVVVDEMRPSPSAGTIASRNRLEPLPSMTAVSHNAPTAGSNGVSWISVHDLQTQGRCLVDEISRSTATELVVVVAGIAWTPEAWTSAIDLLSRRRFVVVQPRLDDPDGRLVPAPPTALRDALVRPFSFAAMLVTADLVAEAGLPDPSFGVLMRWEWNLRLLAAAGGDAELCTHDGWTISRRMQHASPSEMFASQLSARDIDDAERLRCMRAWDADVVAQHGRVIGRHAELYTTFMQHVTTRLERQRELSDRRSRVRSREDRAVIDRLRKDLAASGRPPDPSTD